MWESNRRDWRNNNFLGSKASKRTTKIGIRNNSKPIKWLINKRMGLELIDFVIIISSWIGFKRRGLVDLQRQGLGLRTKWEMRKLKSNFKF